MATILLVEDDKSISRLYGTKLQLEKHTVHYAYNGLQALNELKHMLPDIILLDLKMPIIDGEGFLVRFRKIPKFESIPVVILTNLNREEAPKTIWHYGISKYFVKAHHTPSELANIVEQVLNLMK